MDGRAAPPIRRKHVLSGRIDPDGNIEISNGIVESTAKPSPSLVRKATEGQVTSDGSADISNGLVDSTPKLSPSLVRKATGQVTADGSIEFFGGLVDPTPKISPSLVRKAPGQTTPDSSVEISNGLVEPNPKRSPLMSSGLVEPMPKASPSLVRKATEGQATVDASIEISHGPVDSRPRASQRFVRKATEQGTADGSIEIPHGDSTPQLAPGMARKATDLYRTEGKESRHQLDTSTDIELFLANSETQHEPELAVVPANGGSSRALEGRATTAEDNLALASPSKLEDSLLYSTADPSKVSFGTHLLREDTKAPQPTLLRQSASSGILEISNGLVNSPPRVSPSLVRKATEGQVTADGSIEISNGPVDATPKLSPSLVRKAAGQVTADGGIEISNSLVGSMPKRSPSLISSGPAESIPGPSPSLVRKATEGQVNVNASIDISHGRPFDSAPKVSPSLVRKATEQVSESRHQSDISTDLEPSETKFETQHEPEFVLVPANDDSARALDGRLTSAENAALPSDSVTAPPARGTLAAGTADVAPDKASAVSAVRKNRAGGIRTVLAAMSVDLKASAMQRATTTAAPEMITTAPAMPLITTAVPPGGSASEPVLTLAHLFLSASIIVLSFLCVIFIRHFAKTSTNSPDEHANAQQAPASRRTRSFSRVRSQEGGERSKSFRHKSSQRISADADSSDMGHLSFDRMHSNPMRSKDSKGSSPRPPSEPAQWSSHGDHRSG